MAESITLVKKKKKSGKAKSPKEKAYAPLLEMLSKAKGNLVPRDQIRAAFKIVSKKDLVKLSVWLYELRRDGFDIAVVRDENDKRIVRAYVLKSGPSVA